MGKVAADKLRFSLHEFVESTKIFLPIAVINDGTRPTKLIRTFSARARNFLVAITAVALVFGKDASVFGEQDPFVQEVFSYINEDWLPLILVASILFAIVEFIVPDNVPIRDKISRNITRYAVSFKRKRCGALEIFIGTVLCALGIFYLGYSAHALFP